MPLYPALIGLEQQHTERIFCVLLLATLQMYVVFGDGQANSDS